MLTLCPGLVDSFSLNYGVPAVMGISTFKALLLTVMLAPDFFLLGASARLSIFGLKQSCSLMAILARFRFDDKMITSR